MDPWLYIGAGVLLLLATRQRERVPGLEDRAVQRAGDAVREQIRIGVREMQAQWAQLNNASIQSPPIPTWIPWEERQMRRTELNRLAGMLAEIGAPLSYPPEQLASPAVAQQALLELAALLADAPRLRRGLAVLYAGELL